MGGKQPSPTPAVSAPAPRSATPAAPGSETGYPGWPAPFPLLSGLFPDDCSVLRDAPARQRLHYYHSRSSGNPRGHHSKDAPPGSSPAALPTTDKPPPEAFPNCVSFPTTPPPHPKVY